MGGNARYEPVAEERVTILTEGEQIEGRLFHMKNLRLSDFLNAPVQEESRFVKVKDPKVTLRQTGEVLAEAPFMMIARERIVLVLTHTVEPEPEPAADGDLTPTARLLLGLEPRPGPPAAAPP